jgi:hypothetical protein
MKCDPPSLMTISGDSCLEGEGVNRQNLNFIHIKNNYSGWTGLTGLLNWTDRYRKIQTKFPQQAI